MLGKVVYLNIERRFGRIRENGTLKEFYFSQRDVDPRLDFAGLHWQFVDFDTRESDRGPVAVRIRPVKFPVP